MNGGNYNHLVSQLLKRQLAGWPLAARNYRALAHAQTRMLSVNGYSFIIQFNPARITSSTANMEPQTIRERTCLLCSQHLPPEQEALRCTAQSGNEYLILCNPFPVFPRHLTIADVNHSDQRISGRIKDMLELADQLSDFVLLYNGPASGASMPDHFHFQAGNKGFLPVQTVVESGNSMERYPVPAWVHSSRDAASPAASFHCFFTALQDVAPQEPEPGLNLLCWKTDSKYYLVVFPRKRHRPAQYFAEGDTHILLSPGAVDLGGVLITPLEKDFHKLCDADVVHIIEQISLPISQLP